MCLPWLAERDWNLHPRKPNPDMTRLKDTCQSGEENHLGNTEQVRMEVNTATALVMSAPVVYAAASQSPTPAALVIQDCKDTLNSLGNCYACNKPGHVKRDYPNQTQVWTSFNRGQKREFNCNNCNKHRDMAQDCRLPKKNRGMGASMTVEMEKICQEMMVQCIKKPGDFQ